MKLILTLIGLFISLVTYSQSTLKVTGVQAAKLCRNFYAGNFIDIPFNRDDEAFIQLMYAYVTAYDQSCRSSLPSNKVQITAEECAREQVTTNGYGVEVSRVCVEYKTVYIDKFASPEVYEAYLEVEKLDKGNYMRNLGKVTKILISGNFFGVVGSYSQADLRRDIMQLIRNNGCKSKQMKMFEKNLIRFALKQPPLKLNYDGSVRVVNTSVDYNKNHDLHTLFKDLVIANSKSWAYSYVPNSIHNITIDKDDQGRPKTMSAYYYFNGFLGKTKDIVKITFKDGLPDCIYFPNYSRNCRTPDRKIVSDLVSGRYIN